MDTSGCSNSELPDDFSGLNQLEVLNVSDCRKLVSLVGIKSAPVRGKVDASG